MINLKKIMNSPDPAVRTSKLTVKLMAMTTTMKKKTAISANTTSDSQSSLITRKTNQKRHNSTTEMINISPAPGALESNVTMRRRGCRSSISIAALTKQRSHFSTKSISIAFISYIIFNQLFMTVLISSSGIVLKGAQNPNISSSSSNSGQYKLSSFERSLVGLVAASPAPAPSPAALARSTTSHRLPPMNGSIFGKRDLASGATTKRQTTRSEPIDYNDIITNVIEDFMARNNEVDPEETTVAFCRMIVYECHQVLANHSRRVKTRAPSQRSKSSSSSSSSLG